MVWVGVDGGGTKTDVLVVSQDRVLGFGHGGPSNHEAVGMDGAIATTEAVIRDALGQAGLDSSDVSRMVLGLAGADFPEDIQRLDTGIRQAFPDTPLEIVNDAEIALVAGAPEGWGIAAIAGTGTNAFGKTPSGRRRQLGGLGYEWGDFGSGIDIASAVMHHAFRSAQRRGPKTALEPMVLAMLGQPDYDALARAMHFHEIPALAFLVVVPLCFQIAAQGDEVAQNILSRAGAAIAESVQGLAMQLAMEQEAVPVVMAGSLWLGQAPHMKEAFFERLAQGLPSAKPRITALKPVAGAALMAFEGQGVDCAPLREALLNDTRLSGVE